MRSSPSQSEPAQLRLSHAVTVTVAGLHLARLGTCQYQLEVRKQSNLNLNANATFDAKFGNSQMPVPLGTCQLEVRKQSTWNLNASATVTGSGQHLESIWNPHWHTSESGKCHDKSISKYIQVYDGIYFIYHDILVYTSIWWKHITTKDVSEKKLYAKSYADFFSQNFPLRSDHIP